MFVCVCVGNFLALLIFLVLYDNDSIQYNDSIQFKPNFIFNKTTKIQLTNFNKHATFLD